MTALEKLRLVSVGDYLAGEEQSGVRHEYLGGQLHAMAGGSNRHNTVVLNAQAGLLVRLRGKRCQPFNSGTKVRIDLSDHTRFYYPDAMVVCHPNPSADHWQDHPLVVIEVLSDSTRRVDCGEKRDAYLTIQTLKVLLLVEADEPGVLVYRRCAEGGFATEKHTGIGAVIPLPEIDAELPLAELYERA